MSRHRTTNSPRESKEAQVDLSPAAVKTRNLAKDYGDGPVLQPLDLVVESGESIALIGHNGSGKTTLLRMITGLLDVTSGSISVFGHAPGSLEARRHVSYLSDTPVFYDDLSVWEHLDYTARLHGVIEWEQDAADLLGQLGIYERADDLPSRFSRGLKQKAAIALALIRPFDILLVDEPFVGLDATGRDALLVLLDTASQRGATLLVATHEPSFLERVPRVVALRNGALMFDGPAQDESARAWLHSPS